MGTLGSMQQAALTANTDILSATENRSGTLSGLDAGQFGDAIQSSRGPAGAGLGLYTGGDFIGIAGTAGVENMKAAIDTYCNAVTNKLNQIVETAKPDGTFAGSYASDINVFIKAIKDSCLSTVNDLKLFKKDLDEVYTAMTKHDTNVGESISTDANSINSSLGTEAN